MRIPLLIALVPHFLASLAPAQSQAPAKPALTVVLSVDQLAAWLLEENLPFLGMGGHGKGTLGSRDLSRGGLRRLMDEGVWFTNCRYEHACTTTGPGHATIGTGAPARLHGIVGNDWFDRVAGANVYCVADVEHGQSARRLQVETLGDVLEKSTKGRSQVVGLSLKDRSAILMSGHDADLALWLDKQQGRFVTSSYFGVTPAWVDRFNGRGVVDRYFGSVWTRSGSPADYAGLVDDRPFEAPAPSGRRTLPQVIDGGLDEPGPAYYNQLYTSPFGNDLLLELCKQAISGQHLGEDDVPDLLALGFSSNDSVGHAYGPLSVEVRDSTLRLDRQVASLLRLLDALVGPDRYAFFLTADHGVCAAPEASGRGRRDVRVPIRAVQLGEKTLRDAYGVAPTGERWIRSLVGYQVYIDHRLCAAKGVAVSDAARRLADVLPKIEGIGRAFVSAAVIGDDDLAAAVRDGVFASRSGDVLVVPDAGWLFTRTTATHGSPHDYDRHVPLLVKGPGIRRGHKEATPVSPGVIAVLGAWLCGVDAPKSSSSGPPLDQLLRSVQPNSR